MPRSPTVSIVIATRNRSEDLLRAVRSAEQQSAEEIIVIDDASSDGTANLVRRKFPHVILVSHKEPRGYVIRRNEAALIAKGDVIVSIDDDAEFSTPDVVTGCLKYFQHSSVAAVAIPY